MSFTYGSLEMSGYTTGTTGCIMYTPISLKVSGLKYDGTSLDINKYSYVTGWGFLSSGLATEVSGRLIWEGTENLWYSDIIVSGAVDEQGTGVVEFHYGSGAISDDTGWKLTGFQVFANPNEIAWNMLSNTNGSVDEASSQHYHTGAVGILLSDLGDVGNTGGIAYTSGCIIKANGWTYEETPYTWDLASGDLDDYKYVSGDYSSTSGTVSDYVTHKGNASAHHIVTAISSTPADGITTTGISVDWAYDHVNAADPHSQYMKDLVDDLSPQLGGDLSLNSKAFTEELTAAANLVNGNLSYMNSNGKMAKADADAESTCDTLLAMCTETIATDAVGTFILFGKYTTGGMVAGTEYFVSTVAGTITSTRPSAAGDIVRHVGTALSSTVLFFNPSHTYIEITGA